jgi:hypothetical protein
VVLFLTGFLFPIELIPLTFHVKMFQLLVKDQFIKQTYGNEVFRRYMPNIHPTLAMTICSADRKHNQNHWGLLTISNRVKITDKSFLTNKDNSANAKKDGQEEVAPCRL